MAELPGTTDTAPSDGRGREARPARPLHRRLAGGLSAMAKPALLVLLPAAVLVTLAFLQLRIYYGLVEERREHAAQADMEIARAAGAAFEAYVQDVLRQALFVGLAAAGPQSTSSDYVNWLLTESAHQYPSIRSFHWVSPQGEVLASSQPEAVGGKYAGAAPLQRTAKGQEFAVGDLQLAPGAPEPTFYIARRIIGPQGEMEGTVLAEVDPQRLGHILAGRRTGQLAVTLIDTQGRIVYRAPDPGLAWDQRQWLDADPAIANALVGEEIVSSRIAPFDGVQWLTSSAPVPSTGWAASAARPETEVAGEAGQSLLQDGGLVLLAALAGILAVLVAAFYVAAPAGRRRRRAVDPARGEVVPGDQGSLGGDPPRPLAEALSGMGGAGQSLESRSLRLLQENVRQTRLLRSVLDTAPVGVAVVAGPSLTFLVANPAYRALTPDPEIDPVRLTFAEVWPLAGGVNGPLSILTNVINAGRSLDLIDYELDYPDGSVHYISSHLRYLSWNGEPAVLMVVWETTEQVVARRHAEEDAERIHKLNDDLASVALQMRTVLDELPCGVVIADEEGRITVTNKEADRLFARPVPRDQEYAAQASLQICHPDGSACDPRLLPLTSSALDGSVHTNVELVIRQPGGTVLPVLASSAPIRAAGQLQGAVGVLQDISALKELDRLKDEFLSIAAHELRTPLTSIKGYSQLLQRRARTLPAGEDWSVALDTIESQVNKMVSLVGRLLDVSRIQSNCLELEIESVDLVQTAMGAVAEAQISTKNHRLSFSTEQRTIVGRWDRQRISEVIADLVRNAIQYSPDGGRVEVRIQRQHGTVTLSVEDEGIGIAPEALPHVFERSYRSSAALRHHYQGLGLGLYISNGIVERHGGRMWVESEVGKGSTFYFSLPLSEPGMAEPRVDVDGAPGHAGTITPAVALSGPKKRQDQAS